MWRNYLVIAVRRLLQQPGYSAITIGGLALGLAGCLLMLGYVRYERNYDAWLPDHERVFQVQTTVRAPGQPVVRSQASSFPLYERLAVDFPQVEAITSIQVGKTVAERNGRPEFIESVIVDPTVFRVFALPFLHGSAEPALPDPNAIVLTESEAVRWFGKADVLGRLLRLGAGDGKRDYRVSGVLRDLPRDTSLKAGILFLRDVASIPPQMREQAVFGWGNVDQQHFVKLRRPGDAAAIEAALPAWEDRTVAREIVGGRFGSMAGRMIDFHLQPITAIHLGETQDGALVPGGDPRALATFLILAALTLVMAVINFVNLATARAIGRTREVALRKVLGASRRQLLAQFTLEGVLAAAVATLLALAAVELATPWIGAMLGADLPLSYLGDRGMLIPALALFGVTGLAGGIYPALLLSRVRPARVLAANRGSGDVPGSGRARSALVVVQFAIAIGLIASTAIIVAQTRFVERVDPGYRRDGLLQIANAWRFTQGSEFDAARPLMLAVPGVTAVGRTSVALNPPDKQRRLMRRAGDDSSLSLGFYGVDADFFRTMDVPLLAGRQLGDRFAADRFDGLSPAQLAARGINVVVNRSAAARLGYRKPEAALGEVVQVSFGEWEKNASIMVPATIVGVVADTRLRTMREAVEPIVYAYEPGQTSTVLVRYTAARPAEVMAGLERVWRRFEPEIPFEARFAEDIAYEFHADERARAILFAVFSTLAIAIACLGLYSLAAFATERRTKEIGIRKVLGATVRHIVRLLAWQFSKPVVLANLIAWPLAWWAMRDWLNGFDARIALTPGPFAFAGLLALIIALATVSGHALRVARMNPIYALRYE